MYLHIKFELPSAFHNAPFNTTVANVENNEIRIKNNNVSGHILIALFSICLTFVSHYSAFSYVRGTDANAVNCLKHWRLSHKRRRMQKNVTQIIVILYLYLIILYIRHSENGA